MADEPRRSGRATKGQHTKLDDAELLPTPKRKGKGKGKGTKATSTDPDTGNGEDDAVIRCVCGANEDEQGWMMISCELCEVWQHNLCMGITEVEQLLPDKYYCETCHPQDHADLLAAVERGDKPWEERIQKRLEAEKAKKRRSKGSRKSRTSAMHDNGEDSKSNATTPATLDSGTKRKFEAADERRPSLASTVATPTPSDQRHKSAAAEETTAKRRKSVIEKSKDILPDAPDQLPTKERQTIARALQSELVGLVDKAVKDGAYDLDGQSTSAVGTELAMEIEHALQEKLGGNQKALGEKFRTIRFNVKKNQALLLRLLQKSLSSADLVDMSTDDMASEELQRQRAVMKEEADKQAFLPHEQGPRIRKTHKGEELIGESMESHVPDEPTFNATTIRHREHTVTEREPSPEGYATVELPEDINREPLVVDTAPRSDFDIQNVWDHARSPDQPQGAFPQRTNLIPQPHDPDIDRLLKDEDMSDVPGSPGEVAWSGKIDLAGVASFSANACWVAGGDIGMKIPLTTLIPPTMEISGRILIARADEYVSGMRFSQTTDVTCLLLSPTGSPEDRENAARVFAYFREKQRWGVISPTHPNVRDVYLVPVDKDTELPGFLQLLMDVDTDAISRADALLLTLVVKTRSPPSSAAQTPVLGQAPAVQPPSEPSFSPTGFNGFGSNGLGNAQLILGPFVNTPVVKQLLTAVPNMTNVQLQNLRDILEREPSTRDDIARLGEHLRRRMEE
ncbi:hypothetical protein EJ06DRAFT_559627 [Trichodelitschia bisporula]|uniref:Transcription factor BYE1 n=1 Tax=Trichodelitschia bisporula TaxID=703511 RepID=A0A6G1HM00_9PEZI|nr:hypothetical protein EJ06DRAFT_559627 [Trichodelitschia bisporula]